MTAVLEPPALEDLPGPSRVERRVAARAALGITGAKDNVPLRTTLRENHLTAYPFVALGLLGIVDSLQAQAFAVLTPDIRRSLGLSLGAIGAATALQFIATVVAPLPMARLAQRSGRRAVLCIATALGWSVVTLTTGFVTSLLGLIAVLALNGLSTGSVVALHPPLLVDSYPPQARLRVLSSYRGIVVAGEAASPLLVGVLAGVVGLTWRGVFLALGCISLVTTLLCLRLRDPGAGRFDTERLRAHAEDDPAELLAKAGDVEVAPPAEDIELGFFEIMRRLLLLPTIKRLCAGFLVFGILLIPFATFLSTFLDERWNLGPGARGVFFTGTASAGVLALALWGGRAEKLFRTDPAMLVRATGAALAMGVLCIGLGALSPAFLLMCLLFAVGQAFFALLGPGLNATLLSVVDARYRPHASAIVGLFLASGSILGVIFLNGIAARFGVAGAIVALLVPGVLGAAVLASAGALVDGDLDRMIDTILEEQDIAEVGRTGGRLPMLSARGVDFSYGQLQVLFDVDFTVDEGEMVALLGTNGAGKSTLLKVISGIGLPSSGTVRYRGQDITYLDAERRLRLGITQIPGGRAVFGPLDVIENLRTFGYTLGRKKRAVDEAIELCLEAFPRLRERRSSLAATLSGGEQQMLGLSKALMLRPRLLLIDELSLGLAPIIVAQLLDMVRRINGDGTAVVLVEQSVNIALSLVDHAYFMEKGQVRFDGPAQELLGRDDLLRAVFLEGATKGAQSVSAPKGVT